MKPLCCCIGSFALWLLAAPLLAGPVCGCHAGSRARSGRMLEGSRELLEWDRLRVLPSFLVGQATRWGGGGRGVLCVGVAADDACLMCRWYRMLHLLEGCT